MANTNTPFERGFGKYNKVVVVNNETKAFNTTGNFGAAAIIVAEGSTTGTATLFNGGTIDLAKLAVDVVYEFGVSSITCNAKDVYVLFR